MTGSLLDASFVFPRFPYPGLRPFKTDEWPIFFGREPMIEAVLARALERQLVVVHGDSGCGKSSLVHAGVLPRLEQDHARLGIRWRTCAVRPGSAPLQNLAEQLAGTKQDEVVLPIRRALNFGAAGASEVAEHLGLNDRLRLCVLIDQFEELFAFVRRHGPEEATLFAEFLVGLLEHRPEGLHLILTMRSEFLGACARYRGLAETVNETQYLLPHMSYEDLLRAIREPAVLFGGSVSFEVAERLIADARGEHDELPLIQHGLMRLCRPLLPPETREPIAAAAGEVASPRWRLDLASYGDDVSLRQLLSGHANEIADALEREQVPPRVIQELFRALTDINAEGQSVRRPQKLKDLIEITRTDEATLRTIIDGFRADGASFLQPYDDDPIDLATDIDISHEALIRCWDRIAEPNDGWLSREFQDGLVWRSLLVQAQSFEQNSSSVLAETTATERRDWMAGRAPAWSLRYNGGWDRVQRLIAGSLKAAAAARRRQRWWIAFAVIVLFVGTVAWFVQSETSARTRASRIWDRLDFRSSSLESAELNALWELVKAPPNVRNAFMRELENDPTRAESLERGPEPILRAIYAYEQRPSDIPIQLLERNAGRVGQLNLGTLDVNSAASGPGPEILYEGLAERIEAEDRGAALGRLMGLAQGAKAKTTERNAFATAGEAVAKTLTSDQATAVLNGSVFKSATAIAADDGIVKVYKTVVQRLDPEKAGSALAALLTQLAASEDASRRALVLQVIGESPVQPTAEQVRILLKELSRATTDEMAATRLTAFKNVMGKVKAEQVTQIGPLLLDSLTAARYPHDRDAVTALINALPQGVAVPGARAAFDTLFPPSDRAPKRELLSPLRTVAAWLSPSDAADVIVRLSRDLAHAKEKDHLGHLDSLIQTVAAHVDQARGAEAFKALYDAGAAREPQYVDTVGAGMRAIPRNVFVNGAERALATVLSRWENASDLALRQALEAEMKAIAEHLPASEGGPAIERLLAASERQRLVARRQSLLGVVGVVPRTVPVTDSRRIYNRLLTRLFSAADAQLQQELFVLQALPLSLAPGQGEPVLAMIARRIAQTANPDYRSTLISIFQEISARLPQEEATLGTVVIGRAIASTRDTGRRVALAQALKMSPDDPSKEDRNPTLRERELTKQVRHLALELAKSGNPDEIAARADTLGQFLNGIPSHLALANLAVLREGFDAATSGARDEFESQIHFLERKLSGQAARDEFARLARELRSKTEPVAVQAIESSLIELAARMSLDDQLQRLADLFIEFRDSRVARHQLVVEAVFSSVTSPFSGLVATETSPPPMQLVAPLMARAAQVLRDRSSGLSPAANQNPQEPPRLDAVAALDAVLAKLAKNTADLEPLVAPLRAKGRVQDIELIIPALRAVALHLTSEQQRVVIQEMRAMLAWPTQPVLTQDAAALYAALVLLGPRQQAIYDIVDALKYPTSEAATDILLVALYTKTGERSPDGTKPDQSPGPAAGLGPNLRWAKQNGSLHCPPPRNSERLRCPN